MKKIYLLSSFALAGLLTSCYDLDTAPMGSVITEDQRTDIMEKDPSKIDAISAGVYANYNGFEFCYGDMLDFGYPAVMLQMDSRTADFLSGNADLYGWFSECAEYLDNTYNNPYTLIRWRLPYNIIYGSNQVLSIIDPETTDDSLKYYRAQAHGNRAFAYWFLAQLFQFNYVGHQDDMCVPIVTEENQEEEASNGAPRASVKDVYDLILSDLNNGIELMSNNSAAVRADKRYIDINVMYGLRARTYLCMQEYAKAAQDAQMVINSGAFQPLSSTQAIGPGFIDLTAQNWVWGIYMASEDVHGLYTLSGMLGSYTYGYAYAGMWKCCTNTMFSKISDNDPRKLWWISPAGVSNAQYYTQADGDATAYLEQSGFPPYSVTKFAPYGNVLGQSVNQAEVPLMRIEEMYYILAEAQGMGGSLSQGIATLENFVNSYRWLDKSNPYKCSASNTEEFIDEIFFQREVEFWGEGMTYFDILRLNRDVDRRGTNWEDPTYRMTNYAYYIPAESPVLLTMIPQAEIDNNSQISDADNNPPGVATR
ncbi:MAG: RagB/SusD family nutrient uptake outer membrane protein [Muribaculaceae bacterium]|nr:RagB/SusD family nutrient uptake outer membrane protein [Muribaculaceae bacterium]